MNHVQKYNEAVKRIDARIEPAKQVVYIASEGDVGADHTPIVLPVTRKIACSMIAKGSHRLATAEEIKAHDDAEEKTKRETLSKRQMPMTTDTLSQLTQAIATAMSHNQSTTVQSSAATPATPAVSPVLNKKAKED